MFNFNDFPTEILVGIFDHVPLSDIFPAKMVCKRWFDIIRSSKISQKAAAHIDQQTYLNLQRQGLQKCPEKYIETTIGCYASSQWQISAPILKELHDPYLKNVQTLSLQFVRITASLGQLLTAIGGLKHLRILHMMLIELRAMDMSNAKDLPKSLDLDLDILECRLSYGACFYDVENSELLLALLKTVRRIKSLDLTMFQWNIENTTTQAALLKTCADRRDAIKLEKLNIGFDDGYGNSRNVTEYLELLDSTKLSFRELEVGHNYETIQEWSGDIALNKMPALQSLNILNSYCTSDELDFIIEHVPNLQELQFSFNFAPGKPFNFKILKKLKYLKKLNMLQWIKEKAGTVVPLLTMNPLLELEHLEHLSINGRPQILSLDQTTLSPRNCLATLKSFSMNVQFHETKIDRKSIETLKFMLSRMDSLEDFWFDKFSDIPKEIWPVITGHLKNLQKIGVRWEPDIFEQWKLPFLKEATVYSKSTRPFFPTTTVGETEAIEKSLRHISENWPQLERLETPVMPISEELFEFLRVKCPNLKKINKKVRDRVMINRYHINT